jgi:hypothetical protein
VEQRGDRGGGPAASARAPLRDCRISDTKTGGAALLRRGPQIPLGPSTPRPPARRVVNGMDQPSGVARLRGGSSLALGAGPVVCRMFISILSLLMSITLAAGSHDHGHEHSHGHSHGHGHGHSHAHGHSAVPHFAGGSAAWNHITALTLKHPSASAILASGVVSCSALFVMPFLPFLSADGTTVSVHNSVLLKVLISFAVGGLLGDVFLHMLPHMIARTFSSKDHADEVSQALRFGCPILGGMLIFYLAEKIMAAFSQDSHGHCSTHGHVNPPKSRLICALNLLDHR